MNTRINAKSLLVAVLSATIPSNASAFVGVSPQIGVVSPRVVTPSSALFAIRCEDKYYQLEEMEDKESCTTELFLKGDRTVEFGDTDGPRWVNAIGTWEVKDGTNDFTMKVTRTYSTGNDGSDMGSFSYDTERVFVGEMTLVGASVGITGVAKDLDQGKEIGYFNMIDATEERLSKGQKDANTF